MTAYEMPTDLHAPDAAAAIAGDRWVATLAHELRSPLGAVLMALEELQPACATDPDARAARDLAERGSRHMAKVIEDVLDLCRSAGRPPVDGHGWADLGAAVVGAAAIVRPMIEARGHRLTIVAPPALPPVRGQGSRLEQVLTNLLVNAAKFTPPGGHVWLTVDTPVDGTAVVVRVCDDGIGIPTELLPRVFDAGRQGSCGRSAGGLGIGLAVVRSLVELHGGTVTAHSDGPGLGAEFVVRLSTRSAQ